MDFEILSNGAIHAPFFVFIQCGGAYSDGELLQRFRLAGYKPVPALPGLGPYVCLTEDARWTHIADDWFYTLWHKPSTRDAIAEIAGEHDIFACSVGECDCSWDFVYYRHGRLLRKLVVDDPHFHMPVVVEDFGIPLEGEAVAMQHSDELQIALEIARSLGIDVWHRRERIRVYAPSGR